MGQKASKPQLDQAFESKGAKWAEQSRTRHANLPLPIELPIEPEPVFTARNSEDVRRKK